MVLGRVKYNYFLDFDKVLAKGLQGIGVDIELTTIIASRINQDGNLLACKHNKLPKLAMPGLVTVTLCEVIQLIDPNHEAQLIGVGLPGKVDFGGRRIKECIDMPGWVDVPLADWLEVRLKRKVFISNIEDCHLLGSLFPVSGVGIDDCLVASFGAVKLAFDRFAI